jgi:cell division initiation protein
MDLSPKTLREVEFREKLRGYNQDDVDEFLEQVAVGLEALQDQLRQANERANRVGDQRSPASEEEESESARRVLVAAQRTADSMVREAREQAAEIVAAAEARARAALAQAEDAARLRRETAESDVRAEVQRLATARESLVADVTALEQHLERARSRARTGLGDALRWLDDHLPQALPSPELRTDPAVVAQVTLRPVMGGLVSHETRVAGVDRPETLPGGTHQTDNGNVGALPPAPALPVEPVPAPAPPDPPGLGPSGRGGSSGEGDPQAGTARQRGAAPPPEPPQAGRAAGSGPDPSRTHPQADRQPTGSSDREEGTPEPPPPERQPGAAPSSVLFDADQLDETEPHEGGTAPSPRF